MNQAVRLPKAKRIGHSACPHDCPSTCALEVEILDERTIGRVHGSKDNDYTAGVICAKVARYAEREHHAERLLHPLRNLLRGYPRGRIIAELLNQVRDDRKDAGLPLMLH